MNNKSLDGQPSVEDALEARQGVPPAAAQAAATPSALLILFLSPRRAHVVRLSCSRVPLRRRRLVTVGSLSALMTAVLLMLLLLLLLMMMVSVLTTSSSPRSGGRDVERALLRRAQARDRHTFVLRHVERETRLALPDLRTSESRRR